MVKVKEDLVGKKFGRLTVIEQAEDYINPKTGGHYARWLCECDCEEHNRVIVQQSHLKSKRSLSCGCYNKEKIKETHKKVNEYKLLDDYGILWTSNTKEEVYFNLNDADKILQHCWYKDCEGYPATSINSKTIRLHVFLGLKWHDHQNKNKLDNRRINLRPCTYSQNNMNIGIRIDNTSGIIGVYWFSRDKKWKAQINIDGKTKNLGTFIDKEDAIKTRLNAESKYYGEFAPQKHLFEQYGIKL